MVLRRHRRSVLVTAAALLLGVLPAAPVRAGAVIAVDVQSASLGGAGCSLPEAILAANQDASTVVYNPGPPFPPRDVDTGCAAGAGDDVIVLEPGLYTYGDSIRDPGSHLGAAALPMIDSVITIEGAGAVLQRSPTAAEDFRLLSVGPAGDLDLREVFVRGFAAQGGGGASGGGGGMGAGGAIFVDDGALRVQWSTFQGNVATGGDGSTLFPFASGIGGGGGGGIGGHGGHASGGGGGGGGSRGNGAAGLGPSSGGGGGTLTDGSNDPELGFPGGTFCGGGGNTFNDGFSSADGFAGNCPGGGGGGGADGVILTGDGGAGAFGGGGGGGANPTGNGGDGGFGGGGGSAGTSSLEGDDGGGGGDGGFGGGGGAGPGGTIFGEPGDGGTFGGDASDLEGGGGAGLGGAIFGYRANIIVSNSTFTENAAVRGVAGGVGAGNGADAGGAIFAVGGSTSIVNTTIAGNESTGDGAGLTVYRPTTGEGASLALSNSIIFGNTGRDECFVLNGVTTSGVRNLIATHATDQRPDCPAVYLTADPQLGPLTLNAPGRTPTMALALTSPAIDEALLGTEPPDDQRGVARPQGTYPDIGAFELDGGGVPADTTAPVAAPTAAPPPNGAGWNKTAVTVTWHWADEAGGSGIDPAACTTTSTSSGQGAGIVLSATCADLAGNVGSATHTVHVDLTAPVAAPSAAPAPNAAGWNRSNVTITWGWTDTGGSGIDATACPSSSTSSGQGSSVVVASTCEDVADNTGSASRTVKVDLGAPTVTCGATPVYTIGGSHADDVTATVTDGVSGPAASPIAVDVTAGDVATPGVKSASLTGSDVAGNQTTVACPYVVRYAFLGFLEPLPQATIKAGSSVPVKFRLGTAGDVRLTDAAASALVSACLVQITFDGVVQGCATYNAVSDTFQFDVKSPKSATGAHAIGIRVSAPGGVVNEDSIPVNLKK